MLEIHISNSFQHIIHKTNKNCLTRVIHVKHCRQPYDRHMDICVGQTQIASFSILGVCTICELEQIGRDKAQAKFTIDPAPRQTNGRTHVKYPRTKTGTVCFVSKHNSHVYIILFRNQGHFKDTYNSKPCFASQAFPKTLVT